LGRHLATYYGSAVAVEYIDFLSPRMSEYPNVLLLVQQRNLPLPVISIDGKPKFAGGISVEGISEELERLGVPPLG
jgi:hypothetical protein